jgi:hypothetical protein
MRRTPQEQEQWLRIRGPESEPSATYIRTEGVTPRTPLGQRVTPVCKSNWEEWYRAEEDGRRLTPRNFPRETFHAGGA